MAKQMNKAYKDWSNLASTKRYRYFGIRTRVLWVLTALSILWNAFISMIPVNLAELRPMLLVPTLISAVVCFFGFFRGKESLFRFLCHFANIVTMFFALMHCALMDLMENSGVFEVLLLFWLLRFFVGIGYVVFAIVNTYKEKKYRKLRDSDRRDGKAADFSLWDYKELLDAELITQKDFDRKKEKILSE